MSDLLYTPDGDALGWLGDEEDREFLAEASYEFFGAPEGFTAPKTIDHAWHVPKFQSAMSACAGHAIGGAGEILNYIDTGNALGTPQIVDLSRLYCYIMGQKESGITGDRGATMTGVVESAMKNGIPQEATCPYPNPVRYTTDIPEAAHAEAQQHKILHHTKLRSYQEVFDYLATGTGVVVIGIQWTESLANARGKARSRIEASTGKSYGGHALLLAGYNGDVCDARGRPYLFMSNWHGLEWGWNGRAIVSPPFIDRSIREQYSEYIGVSDMQEYGVARKTSGWASRIKPF